MDMFKQMMWATTVAPTLPRPALRLQHAAAAKDPGSQHLALGSPGVRPPLALRGSAGETQDTKNRSVRSDQTKALLPTLGKKEGEKERQREREGEGGRD